MDDKQLIRAKSDLYRDYADITPRFFKGTILLMTKPIENELIWHTHKLDRCLMDDEFIGWEELSFIDIWEMKRLGKEIIIYESVEWKEL